MDIKDYIRKRDQAILSLDKEKICAFCKECRIHLPDNEEAFWAGVHKIIIHLNAAPFEQKLASYEWLVEHGFNPEIRFGDNDG